MTLKSLKYKYLFTPLACLTLMACSGETQDVNAEDAIIQTASNRFMVSRNNFPVKRCVNMGNALEAEQEGSWGYTIQEHHLQKIAQAGFDTIRIPIRWDAHTSVHPPYTIDIAFMERVKEVVGQAQSYGMGVIIDVHHYESLIKNPRTQTNRFIAIWDQIANVFQYAPPNVYFEIVNEPTRDITSQQVNALYRAVIPVIRRTNPTRVLIIGGNSWNSLDTLKEVDFPQDPNVIATFHDYAPHNFTHQGATWTENPPPMGEKWGSPSDYAALKSDYQMAKDFQSRSNRPIFVGEFGVIDTVPLSERVRWTLARRKAIEQAGFSWCVWDFAGGFSIYDKDREQWRPGMLEALMGR